MPLLNYSVERTVAKERATKGHTNDTHQEDGSRCQALASDSLVPAQLFRLQRVQPFYA